MDRVVRKTGSVKLGKGYNKVDLPVGFNLVGFDNVGSLKLIWDAPGGDAEMAGTQSLELHVVPVGEELAVDCDGWQVVGFVSPTSSRALVIYQTHRFL